MIYVVQANKDVVISNENHLIDILKPQELFWTWTRLHNEAVRSNIVVDVQRELQLRVLRDNAFYVLLFASFQIWLVPWHFPWAPIRDAVTLVSIDDYFLAHWCRAPLPEAHVCQIMVQADDFERVVFVTGLLPEVANLLHLVKEKERAFDFLYSIILHITVINLQRD